MSEGITCHKPSASITPLLHRMPQFENNFVPYKWNKNKINGLRFATLINDIKTVH